MLLAVAFFFIVLFMIYQEDYNGHNYKQMKYLEKNQKQKEINEKQELINDVRENVDFDYNIDESNSEVVQINTKTGTKKLFKIYFGKCVVEDHILKTNNSEVNLLKAESPYYSSNEVIFYINDIEFNIEMISAEEAREFVEYIKNLE